MGLSLLREVSRDHLDIQGLCRTDPIPPWMQCSGELAPSITTEQAALRREGPVPHLGSTVELFLAARLQVSPPQVHERGTADPATCLPRLEGYGCPLSPHLLTPEAVKTADPRES